MSESKLKDADIRFRGLIYAAIGEAELPGFWVARIRRQSSDCEVFLEVEEHGASAQRSMAFALKAMGNKILENYPRV